MDGFVTDYINTLTAELGRQPTYEEYSQVMTGFTPEQMPVLSGLGARVRRVRSLVLRGAVADVHQPVVLDRGDGLGVRGELAGHELDAEHRRNDLQPA